MYTIASVAAFAGAAAAAWAPPAYGGASSESSSSAPAYGGSWGSSSDVSSPSAPAYGASSPSAPAYGVSPSPSAPAYGVSSPSAPAYGVPPSSPSAPAYGASSPSAPAYGVPSSPSAPAYGGSWGSSSSVSSHPSAPAYGGWSSATFATGYGPKPTGSNTSPVDYVTAVVTSFETYCPYATTLSYGSKTYTVTEATTLTITDCPGGCHVTMPAHSLVPSYTTDIITEVTTYCPEQTTFTHSGKTYTATSATTITLEKCPGGCTTSHEVPVTVVVPSYTSVCESPSAPTTITIGTQTYPVSDKTTITVSAPTSWATSVYTSPAKPTTVMIGSSTYPVSDKTTIVVPTVGGYTITTPVASVPGYSAPPAAWTQPAGPAGGAAPSGWGPAGNGTSPVSPYVPMQTGNGAGKVVAGGVAFGALFAGALLL